MKDSAALDAEWAEHHHMRKGAPQTIVGRPDQTVMGRPTAFLEAPEAGQVM